MAENVTDSWAGRYAAMFGKCLTAEEIASWDLLLRREFGQRCNSEVAEAISEMTGQRRYPPTFPEVRTAVQNARAKQTSFPTACARCRGGWMYFRAIRGAGMRIEQWSIDADCSFNTTGIECVCPMGEKIFKDRVERGDYRSEQAEAITTKRRQIYDEIGRAGE